MKDERLVFTRYAKQVMRKTGTDLENVTSGGSEFQILGATTQA